MKNGIVTNALFLIMIFVLTSCMSLTNLTSSAMNKLELGMSKIQVEQILGKEYTIAEKRIENGIQIELLSYRSFYNINEYYMFLFKDDRLEEWYRDIYTEHATVKKE